MCAARGMLTEISFATLHKCISSGGWVLICADPGEGRPAFPGLVAASAAAVGLRYT